MKERRIKLQDLPTTGILKIGYFDGDIAFLDSINTTPNFESAQLDLILMGTCVKGRLQLNINDKQYLVKKGEKVFCCHYNVVSHFMASPDFEGKVICLSHTLVQRILYNNQDILNRLYFLEKNPVLPINEEEQALFQKLYDLVLTIKNCSEHLYQKEIMTSVIQGGLYAMLGNLNNVPTIETNIVRQPDLLLFNFKNMLASDNGLHRYVNYYAKKLCITPQYLNSICNKKTGFTASTLIREKTTERISYLLKNSSLSIKEISNELDFPNISFFGKFVKNNLGYSPTDYRNNFK